MYADIGEILTCEYCHHDWEVDVADVDSCWVEDHGNLCSAECAKKSEQGKKRQGWLWH